MASVGQGISSPLILSYTEKIRERKNIELQRRARMAKIRLVSSKSAALPFANSIWMSVFSLITFLFFFKITVTKMLHSRLILPKAHMQKPRHTNLHSLCSGANYGQYFLHCTCLKRSVGACVQRREKESVCNSWEMNGRVAYGMCGVLLSEK